MRGRVFAATRSFFGGRGYVEVETPLRVATPALEDHIDAEPSGDAWLRTSPELHMKRLVCAGMERIYQIGACFRRGERGSRHCPEYTMLEWYRTGADCEELIGETSALLRAIAAAEGRTEFGGIDLTAEPAVFDVREVFWLWAGWDPWEAFDAERFDLDLVGHIEPMLAEQQVPVILRGFPPERAALSRIVEGTAQRWELYLGGMELANAYTELADPVEQRARFVACAEARRARGQEVYPLDEPFLSALSAGMPPCAGIALGMDRLLMWLVGARDIAEVRAFVDG